MSKYHVRPEVMIWPVPDFMKKEALPETDLGADPQHLYVGLGSKMYVYNPPEPGSQRAMFETYYISGFRTKRSAKFCFRFCGNRYLERDTQRAWEFWQYAQKPMYVDPHGYNSELQAQIEQCPNTFYGRKQARTLKSQMVKL